MGCRWISTATMRPKPTARRRKAKLPFEEKRFSTEAHDCNFRKERFGAVWKAAFPFLYKLDGEKKILALIEMGTQQSTTSPGIDPSPWS
jgi:hypothetical protein